MYLHLLLRCITAHGMVYNCKTVVIDTFCARVRSKPGRLLSFGAVAVGWSWALAALSVA